MGTQEKSVIIIGAGFAGLSAGCYARMNGYRTKLFEMHDKPGGVCTSWQRGDYTINGCVHWVIGTAPPSPLYRMWEELGAVQGRQLLYLDTFMRIEGLDGHTLVTPTNLDLLQQRLLELAPEDEKPIRKLIRIARASTRMRFPLKPPELFGVADKLRALGSMLPVMVRAGDWLGLSVGEAAERFKSPLLREGVLCLGPWPPETSLLFLLVNLGLIGAKQAGYPMGGSLPFSRTLEARYRELGGELHYTARVTRILVENGRAVGIRLANGEEHRADAVISAADGHTTLFELLEGRYMNDELRELYQRSLPFPGMLHVAFGVRRRFDDVPHAIMGLTLPLPEPIQIVDQEHRRVLVDIDNHDPTLAPEGHTVVKVLVHTDYAGWAALHEDPERYAAEKERIANQLLAALERRFPGISSQVEMRDVATPMTFEHFTGNWKGAYEGWIPTPEAMRKGPPRTLPGLESFYMAGQWIAPGGGLPIAALSGRQSIQLLRAREGRPFVTSRPGERPRAVPENVGQAKQVASVLLGGTLLTLGLKRRSLIGAGMMLASGVLLFRGLSRLRRPSRTPVLEPRTARVHAEPLGVERRIIIDRPADELYRLFREPRTLARCMEPLAQITSTSADLMHWKLGQEMEFDTRFVEDRPGELLRWESLEGAEHQGSVRFRPAHGNEGTEVTLRITPPGPVLATTAARVMAGWVLGRALRRFKHLAETSPVPPPPHPSTRRPVAPPAFS